jgi:glycosyltransferase involved in cell wall biosynthesis
MKIAINTRLMISGKLDGIGWFTYHTTRHLSAKHPDVDFIFIFDRPWNSEFIHNDNVRGIRIGPPARHPLLYYMWYEHSLPKLLKDIRPDLLVHPDGFACLKTDIPQVSVMHDLNFEHYPGDLPFMYRKYYRLYFPKFASKARRLATVSEYSKQDIISTYSTDPGKIDVVYNGVNDVYEPLDEMTVMETRKSVSYGKPYFLFVGSLHPRKNIAMMLQAFDIFCTQNGNTHKFVIVGDKKWWTHEIKVTYEQMKHRSEVVFTGRMSIDELKNTCGAAFCMLYVSVFEGFGVPIIEAMRCGVPVITSDVTSMPEVAGGAALLAKPGDPADICDKMLSLAADEDLAASISRKGLIRSKDFSWERTSGLLWDCMMNAL